jgi:hypothetical protein
VSGRATAQLVNTEAWPPRAFAVSTGSAAIHAAVILIVLCTVGVFLLASSIDAARNVDPVVLGWLSLNTLTAAFGLSWSLATDAISLRVMFWYYYLLFFGLVPLAQYITGYWLFPVADTEVVTAAVLVCLSAACFASGYAVARLYTQRRVPSSTGSPRRVVDRRSLGIIAVATLAAAVVLTRTAGFSLTHSPVLRIFGGEFTPASMVAEFFVRPFVFFVLVFGVYAWRYGLRSPSALALVGAGLVASQLVIGPLSGARFLIFALYLGLLLVAVPPRPRQRYLYLGLLVIGVVGSHLQNLARAWIDDPDQDRYGAFSTSYFFEGHFDGFENLAHSVSFVRASGVEWGRQMAGAVLFWMPRELWPDKPVGSAKYIATSYLANYYEVHHTNIAAPFLQEAFLNFHILGVIAMFLVLGVACGRSDVRFRFALREVSLRGTGAAVPGDHLASVILYPVMIGLLLFILRGDLLSSLAFTMGIVAAFTVLAWLVTRSSPSGAD